MICHRGRARSSRDASHVPSMCPLRCAHLRYISHAMYTYGSIDRSNTLHARSKSMALLSATTAACSCVAMYVLRDEAAGINSPATRQNGWMMLLYIGVPFWMMDVLRIAATTATHGWRLPSLPSPMARERNGYG